MSSTRTANNPTAAKPTGIASAILIQSNQVIMIYYLASNTDLALISSASKMRTSVSRFGEK